MDRSVLLLQLLSLASLALAANSSLIRYGMIFPQSPVVEIGQTFTATCVLYDTAQATADDIYWTLKDVTVPEEQYTKINQSAVSVTITITRDTPSWLMCKTYNKQNTGINKLQIHGIIMKKGYVPVKPERLSCMAVQSGSQISANVSCFWDAGKMEELPGGVEEVPTTYTLFATIVDSNKTYNSKAQRSSGFITFGTFPMFMELEVWVEVENGLGKVYSDVLGKAAEELVKMNPPSKVIIISEKQFARSLIVNWTHPIHKSFGTLKYNIRYCKANAEEWTEVPRVDTQEYRETFRLQSLRPDTMYVVQVRCIQDKDYGYWSDWSSNTTARTSETEPSSKPDLWRVVMPIQGQAERRIQLMSKAPVECNGRVRSYRVKIQDWDWENVVVNGSEAELEAWSQERKITVLRQITLSEKRRVYAEVIASNSAGQSPSALLVIPKVTQEPPPVESLGWYTHEGQLWVEWQPPNMTASLAGLPRAVTEYLVEWVSVSDGQMDWQREGKQARTAAIRGKLEKYKRYDISVYPLYSGMVGKPVTTATFLEQGVPLEGPSVKLRPGTNEAEVEWMEIPLDRQQGFITNYTIYYTTGGQEHSVSVSPDTYSYTLRHLSSSSNYMVRVMASTVVGHTNSTDFSFITHTYAPGQIEGIVVGACFAFLFVVLMTMLLCMCKKDSIKKIFWPVVPDPSNSTIATWTPDFPTKADSPKESILTDVSVVEVDVFDRKSLYEEDKTCLPLKKDKYLSEEHSSGIGGSSCMSSPRQSVSDSDEGGDSGQTTASTVQYSSVVAASTGYKTQTPGSLPPQTQAQHVFARSESTQPLLDSEEHPDLHHHHLQEGQESRYPRNPYFRRSPAGNEDSRPPAEFNQLEMEEQGGASSLRFSPLEEGSQQTTPTEEEETPDWQPTSAGPAPSYMPQLSGYRPQ